VKNKTHAHATVTNNKMRNSRSRTATNGSLGGEKKAATAFHLIRCGEDVSGSEYPYRVRSRSWPALPDLVQAQAQEDADK
jgi:hypothetical protein